MSDLKSVWKTAHISQIADHCLGKMLDKQKNKGELKPYLRNLNVRWFDFDLSDVLEMRFEEGEAARYQAEAGDLIICEGGYPGRAAIWESEEAIYLQKALHRVRFAEPAHAKWVLYWLHLKDLDGTLANSFSGTGIQHFTKAALARFEVPLPPLDEQKRIVAVLDQAFAALDRARAHAEANLADGQALFDAWLTSVFHDHPASWKVRKLKDLCHRITVGHVGPMMTRYEPDGVRFLRSQNVRPFQISLEDVKYVSEEFHAELKKSELHAGDVAIVRTGYPGTAAVIPESLGAANCADLVIARPNSELSADFLVMFLNSSFGKDMVASKAVGAAQKHFNVGAAKEVDFAYPELEEQMALADKAVLVRSRSEKLKAVYVEKLADIANLRQSLLQKAFSGELT